MSNALETLIASMTISDLARAGGVSVASLVEFALGKGSKPKAPKAAPLAVVPEVTEEAPKASRKAKKAAPVAPSAEVDTRSVAGRTAYQEAVFAAVKAAKEQVNAQAVRAVAGGTPAQCRAALNALIYEGKVTYEGKARATVYSIA